MYCSICNVVKKIHANVVYSIGLIPAITKVELLEMLSYNDRIIMTEIQGKYVLEALEQSVKDAWALDPFKGPWVLQVSGK